MKKLTCLFYLQILHILSEILVHCQGQLPFPAKIATQINTYMTSTADRAIDNNPNTCSLVAVGDRSSVYGWWQVDLGDVFIVYSVTITSGANDGVDPRYVQNFDIFAGMTNNTYYTDRGLSLCYYFNNGSYLTPGIPATFTCSPNPLYGRYVTIKRTGGFRQDALGLCEVGISYNFTGSMASTSLSTTSTTRSIPVSSYAVSEKSISSISSFTFGSYSEHNGWSSTVKSSENTASGESHVQNCECQTSVIASIVLGILLGISVACNVFLVINNFNLRRQHQQHIEHKPYELNQPNSSNGDQPNSYEQLRISDRSTIQMPNQREASQNQTHEADYESVTSTN